MAKPKAVVPRAIRSSWGKKARWYCSVCPFDRPTQGEVDQHVAEAHPSKGKGATR